MTEPILPTQGPKRANALAKGSAPQAAPAKPDAKAMAGDAVAAAGLGEASAAAQARVASLNGPQLEGVAQKKATCPFMAAAVATRALPVRQSADKPLGSIEEVVALGNSGGGNLGEVLRLFAQGNHAFGQGADGKLDAPLPAGLFSLDFPGSQGSHPGHSGILQGDPKALDSGRFSPADFDRLISRAQGGCVKRSDIGRFIAENLVRDPESKVLSGKVAKLVAGDVGALVGRGGSALVGKLREHFTKHDAGEQERQAWVALTKALGEENLVGSAGEFGLLMAFLVNSPRTKTVDGEPALAVEDLRAMFQEHRFPEGWEHWPKTAHDWVSNTTALSVSAAKAYHGLKGKKA